MQNSICRAFLAIAVFAASLVWSGGSRAAQLVMLEQAGCIWCQRWNKEIAPAYPNTLEGKRAPLRRVDIDLEWPADLAGIKSERFTPTFILVEGGIEIARMRGYPGDDFFWFLLDEMLQKLPQDRNRCG